MKRLYIVIAAVAGLALIAGINASQSNDTNKNTNNNASENAPGQSVGPEKKEDNKTTATSDANGFNYAAQKGDSYSLMTRKALQAYNQEVKAGLSQAQIMFAETNLTIEASKPYLQVGQKITITKDKLKSWTDKAKLLTAGQVTAWDSYAKLANFDTSKVGVAN